MFAETVQGTIHTEYSDVNAAEMFENASPDATITVTPGDFDLLVLNNTARLISRNGQGDDIDVANPNNISSWPRLLDMYPGKFRAGLSQLRFTQPAGNDVIAYLSLDPSDDFAMRLSIDNDTIPSNTTISGRGTVDAVINPETFNPTGVANGTRYLILEDININSHYGQPGYDGPDAWKNTDLSDFQAHANDIIEWNSGAWSIVFDSAAATEVTYITNSYTGTQYKWNEGSWSKSYEGIYEAKLWRLIL